MATKNQTPVTTPAIELTPELIAKVLAGMTASQLATAAKDRQQASLAPMIQEYRTTEERLTALRSEISKISPEWRPPSLDDKIVAFVGSGQKIAEEIRSQFRSQGFQYGTLKMALKRLAENSKKEENRLTLRDGNYGAIEAKA
ncbi:MAG: hypothetical protein ACLQVX_19545 [Limisphaerales bacterium]